MNATYKLRRRVHVGRKRGALNYPNDWLKQYIRIYLYELFICLCFHCVLCACRLWAYSQRGCTKSSTASSVTREIVAIALSAGLDSVSKQTKVGNTSPLLHDITQ